MLYTKHTNVTGTAEVVLLTVPTGFVAHVSYILVANNHASSNNCSMHFDDGTNELYVLKTKAIASDAKEEFYRGVFVLQPGDQVKVQTSILLLYGTCPHGQKSTLKLTSVYVQP